MDGTLKDFSEELKQGLAEMQSYAQSWASSSEGGLRLIPGPRGEPSRRNEQLSKETCEWRTTFRNLARLVEQAPSLFEDVRETIDCEDWTESSGGRESEALRVLHRRGLAWVAFLSSCARMTGSLFSSAR